MFAFGAFLPLIPFFFRGGSGAVVAAAAIAAVSLLTVGALTSLLTGRSPAFSAFRQLTIGVLAAVVTYAIGRLVGVSAPVLIPLSAVPRRSGRMSASGSASAWVSASRSATSWGSA